MNAEAEAEKERLAAEKAFAERLKHSNMKCTLTLARLNGRKQVKSYWAVDSDKDMVENLDFEVHPDHKNVKVFGELRMTNNLYYLEGETLYHQDYRGLYGRLTADGREIKWSNGINMDFGQRICD